MADELIDFFSRLGLLGDFLDQEHIRSELDTFISSQPGRRSAESRRSTESRRPSETASRTPTVEKTIQLDDIRDWILGTYDVKPALEDRRNHYKTTFEMIWNRYSQESNLERAISYTVFSKRLKELFMDYRYSGSPVAYHFREKVISD